MDGVAVVLPDAACGALAGEGPSAACSSPLPPLAPGQHTLELGTRITRYGTVLESERSAPLVVTVAGAVATASAWTATQPSVERGPDAVPYVVELAAQGLDGPAALADCRTAGC